MGKEIADKIQTLIEQMTLKEKVGLCTGASKWTTIHVCRKSLLRNCCKKLTRRDCLTLTQSYDNTNILQITRKSKIVFRIGGKQV